MDKERYRLYIWMRTDLASLNTGKAMAQAAHAANMAHFDMTEYAENIEAWRLWAGERDFGTTIVFEVHYKLSSIIEMLSEEEGNSVLSYGIVNDPTYPLKNGAVTHFIPVVTCAYAFIDLTSLKDKGSVDALIGTSTLHK